MEKFVLHELFEEVVVLDDKLRINWKWGLFAFVLS
jgi:hypothetical protein